MGFSKLLKNLGIKPTIDLDLALTQGLAPKRGMHSFRDTVIQAMQGCADEELRKAYVGHQHQSRVSRQEKVRGSHEVAYMRAWTQREVARVFSGLSWREWLDIAALRGLLDQSDDEHIHPLKHRIRREASLSRTQ